MTLWDVWTFRVRLSPVWWTIKRPWCWLAGHRVVELMDRPEVLTPKYRGYATHMCGRCLKFWDKAGKWGK